MQDGSCLVAMCGWLLTSSGMDFFFFSSCGRGQLCTCGGIDFSLVLVYKILYSCDVKIISSSRGAPLYV